MTSVTALVVTYDHEHEIAACVEAALAQEGLQLDVVVVDNASSDRTVEVLRGFGDRITLVALDRNTGFAQGMNTAFGHARGEHVLFLNPDVVMDPGCVAALAEHLRQTPSTAAAAALLRNPDGSAQLFCRRDPAAAALFFAHTAPGRRIDARRGWRANRAWRYAELWDGRPEGPPVPTVVDAPACACVLVPCALLGERPFDPRFPLFFNDGDLFRRLRDQGRHAVVVPEATALHGYATSVTRAMRNDLPALRAEWVAASLRHVRLAHGRAQAALAWMAYLCDALWLTAAHGLGRGDASYPGRVRGALGGLGLPGGAAPFLSPPIGPFGLRRRLTRILHRLRSATD